MRIRAVAGLAGGSLLLLSSVAHAFLGWPAVSTAIKDTNATAELTTDIAIGWLFGSVAMLAFGLIVLLFGVRLWQGKTADRRPVIVIAVCYFGFGLGAFFWTHFHPHFIGFMVIGFIVATAAVGPGKSGHEQTR